MCLGTKLSDRSLARYKAKGKKCGYIRVWKVVRDFAAKYRPQHYPSKGLYNVLGGFVHARQRPHSEQGLIHAFRDKKSAKGWLYWSSNDCIIIEAIVRPAWVLAVGLDIEPIMHTLTTKAIVMPKYPKRKVTVAEFRKAVKGKKVKKYSWEK